MSKYDGRQGRVVKTIKKKRPYAMGDFELVIVFERPAEEGGTIYQVGEKVYTEEEYQKAYPYDPDEPVITIGAPEEGEE